MVGNPLRKHQRIEKNTGLAISGVPKLLLTLIFSTFNSFIKYLQIKETLYSKFCFVYCHSYISKIHDSNRKRVNHRKREKRREGGVGKPISCLFDMIEDDCLHYQNQRNFVELTDFKIHFRLSYLGSPTCIPNFSVLFEPTTIRLSALCPRCIFNYFTLNNELITLIILLLSLRFSGLSLLIAQG